MKKRLGSLCSRWHHIDFLSERKKIVIADI